MIKYTGLFFSDKNLLDMLEVFASILGRRDSFERASAIIREKRLPAQEIIDNSNLLWFHLCLVEKIFDHGNEFKNLFQGLFDAFRKSERQYCEITLIIENAFHNNSFSNALAMVLVLSWLFDSNIYLQYHYTENVQEIFRLVSINKTIPKPILMGCFKIFKIGIVRERASATPNMLNFCVIVDDTVLSKVDGLSKIKLIKLNG